MTQILEEIQGEKDKPHCQNGRLQHFSSVIDRKGREKNE